MLGFFSELCDVLSLNLKEIVKEFKIVYISCGAIMVLNYIKILSYSKEKIVLKVQDNELNIEGINLFFKEISKSQIIAKGIINKIYLSREIVDEKKQGK